MNIHKTSGTNAGMVTGKTSGKAAPSPSAQNGRAAPTMQNTQATAVPKTPAQTIKPLPANSLPSLIAAAGLPADKLSASIISFARFFSLPIKPELMASIRRQGLLSPEDTAKAKEAFSLAAAAAESKGMELRPKGLELFAEAINPDLQRRHDDDSDERRRNRRNKGQNEQENAPKNNLSASGIRELALESAEKDPLLAILNRIPGKNGRRWVVLPFSFGESGRKYRVSLRILLETDSKTPDRAVCMAMDIAESPDIDGGGVKNDENAKNERRWSFVLSPADGVTTGMAAGSAGNLTVYLQPELPPDANESFSLELAHLMGMPPQNVSVKSRAESSSQGGEFPCELGGENDLLRSVNEAV